jgi:hypothetical protein
MIIFPQYRRYSHGKTWYKIHSPDKFTELTVLGSRYLIHEIEAKQYPEKLRIADMLDGLDGTWICVTEADYDTFLVSCKNNLQAGTP